MYNQNDGYIGKYIECDHIIPIALGGAELDQKNLQTLCVKCHKEKTKEDIMKLAEIRREEKERLEAIELEKKGKDTLNTGRVWLSGVYQKNNFTQKPLIAPPRGPSIIHQYYYYCAAL